jgi:hypothetical protein
VGNIEGSPFWCFWDAVGRVSYNKPAIGAGDEIFFDSGVMLRPRSEFVYMGPSIVGLLLKDFTSHIKVIAGPCRVGTLGLLSIFFVTRMNGKIECKLNVDFVSFCLVEEARNPFIFLLGLALDIVEENGEGGHHSKALIDDGLIIIDLDFGLAIPDQGVQVVLGDGGRTEQIHILAEGSALWILFFPKASVDFH